MGMCFLVHRVRLYSIDYELNEMIMNQNLKNIGGLVLLVLFMLGCHQASIDGYENDPRLYFFKGNYNLNELVQNDSIIHSFYGVPESQLRDTVWIDIRTMGYLGTEPRAFKIVQVNPDDEDAAVPGVHYVDFEDSSIAELMKIPAKAFRYLMPVILLRDQSLETKTVRIRMAIAENENFGVGIDTLSRFLVTTTSAPAKPANWDSKWKLMFGTWGAKKMWFIMNYIGITDFDEVDAIKDYTYTVYLKTMAQDKIKEYNNNVNNPDRPLKEADGTEVKF